MKWYSILRHYKRVDWYNSDIMQVEFVGYIVFDIKVDYDMRCDPSLLSMLWLFTEKVRAEVDLPFIEHSWWGFPGLIKREEKNKEELAAISSGAGMAETERQLKVDKADFAAYTRYAVKDTAKAIKRLQADMQLSDMRRRDRLKEAREMMPVLRRSPLGKILGAHNIEPQPNYD